MYRGVSERAGPEAEPCRASLQVRFVGEPVLKVKVQVIQQCSGLLQCRSRKTAAQVHTVIF